MSGIAGFVRLDGAPADPALLAQMQERLRHRAVDGSGSFVRGPAALAHQMLHATPEAVRERQPLASEDARYILTFDGRLDNRDELAGSIARARLELRDDTDAELVLKAHIAWGAKAPAKMLGDFAYAVWDERERELALARDHMGVKPLFYHRCDGAISFSSEFHALFALPWVPREPHLEYMAQVLLNQRTSARETIWRGILLVDGAHVTLVRGGSVRADRYWDVDPGRVIRYGTDREYAEHYLTLLKDAVRVRMRTRNGVGVTLSGGLDSSSIAVVAQRLCGETPALPAVHAFGITFDGMSCDERGYMEDVVRYSGIPFTALPFRGDDRSMDLEAARLTPDIRYSVTVFMFGGGAQLLRSKGITVLLDGIGGDELFMPWRDHLADLLAGGRVLAWGRQLLGEARYWRMSPWDMLRETRLEPLVPERLRSALLPLRRTVARMRGRYVLPPPGFVTPLLARRARERGREAVPAPRGFGSRSKETLYHYATSKMAAAHLGPPVSAWAAHVGLDSRQPFCDHRLLEYVLALPDELRWKGGDIRYLQREGMRGLLPESVRTRVTKAEFAPPIHEALWAHRAPAVERLLQRPAVAELGLVDYVGLSHVLQESRSGSPGALTRLELLLALELALQSEDASHHD